MINKYLLIAIGVLGVGCLTLFNMWDNTRQELNAVKAQKITLEKELKRRDENEKNLSKRISELNEIYGSNADWAGGSVPPSLSLQLRKSCKACK